jgi:hypothetical protein
MVGEERGIFLLLLHQDYGSFMGGRGFQGDRVSEPEREELRTATGT